MTEEQVSKLLKGNIHAWNAGSSLRLFWRGKSGERYCMVAISYESRGYMPGFSAPRARQAGAIFPEGTTGRGWKERLVSHAVNYIMEELGHA